jgi:glycosyltransferase involved in cell wall biosynthesis
MKRKVWFILDVRFPTEKAYGVTTNFTAKAVQNLGSYDVSIITPKLDSNFSSDVETIEVLMPLSRIRETGLRSGKFISKITFSVWKYAYALKLNSIIERKNSIVWLRDIRISLILSCLRYKVVCEIHRRPSIWSRFELFILKCMPNLTLVLISNDLRNYLGISVVHSEIGEMAVNEYELNYENTFVNSCKFIVGYVGSANSSGNELSIDVVLKAATILEKINSNVLFEIIGFYYEDLVYPLPQYHPRNVKFLGRLDRSGLLKELDSFSLGLLIYPDTKYFQDSFPIKIVEYAARKVPIIASDTKAHRRILGEDKALYFNINSPESLAESILKVIKNSNVLTVNANNAFEWVKELTYSNRAKKILKKADFL